MIKTIALLSPLFMSLYPAIILFATAYKKHKNRFCLGLFFFCSFLLFVGHFLSFNEYWISFRYFNFLYLAAILSYYPLYYLYILCAFNAKILTLKWIYHFLPAILIGTIMLIATLFNNWESYHIYMDHNIFGKSLSTQASKILSFIDKGTRGIHIIQILAYNFVTIRFILNAENKMKNIFSNLDKYQLQSFYIVSVSFITLMSIPGLYVTIIGRAPLNNNSILLLIICLFFTLLYLILAIIGLRQVPVEININNVIEIDKENSIAQNELIQIEKNLLHFFKNEKPWLSPNLNILDVAKHIGTNRSYISKAINERIGCNFNLFVNRFRITEAKLLLNKTPELPISEISEQSGFGSINSFIRCFKTIENCTPTEFRKKTL